MAMEYLDMLVAFSGIMLGVSLIITVLTHIVTILLGMRGSELARGLETLFKHTGLDLAGAKALAEKVLTHELISDHAAKIGWRSTSATAIRQGELREILVVLAEHDAELKAKLDQLKAGVDTWFDSVMDRVTQWFSSKSRVVTVSWALVVAFGLQLDAVGLLHQLSSDAGTRAELAAVSSNLMATAETVPGAVRPASADPPTAADADALSGSIDQLRAIQQTFESAQFQLIPQPYRSYWDWRLLFGILASAALLSLGAPFWFNALGTLSALRPVVAGRQDQERRAAAAPR